NEPLVAGLAAFVQEDGSSVVGEVDFRAGRAIIRRGNQVLVTSAPFEAAPNQWHRLFLEPGPGTLRLLVDGVERARVNTSTLPAKMGRDFAQGPLALTSQTRNQNYVDFDDVRVATNDAISDDFRTQAVGRWDDVAGAWQTRIESKSAVGRRVKISAGTAITLTGNAEREEGLVEATFAAVGKPANQKPTRQKVVNQSTFAAGVVFAARDGRNYFLARHRSGFLEIVEVAKGVGKILGRAKVLSTPPAPAISVQWREGVITARGAGATATAVVAEVPAGRVGAWSDAPAASVALASFRAMGAAPGWGEAPLPSKIVKDRLMKYWASNATAWKRANDTWWHSGDFFRDAAISLPLPKAATGTSISLLLASNPAQKNSGSRLELVRTSNGWNTTLWEGMRQIKSATISAAADQSVRFVRRPLEAGRALLRVATGARPLLNETVATATEAATKVGVRVVVPGRAIGQGSGRTLSLKVVSQERNKVPFVGVSLSPIGDEIQREFRLPDKDGVLIQELEANGPGVGAGLQSGDVIRSIDGQAMKTVEDVVDLVKAKGVGKSLEFRVLRQTTDNSGIDWEQAVASTSNLLDYTFTSAPVDWKATQGRWEVAERWTCNPEWAFFVGANAVNPTLWSRFRTRGDYTMEAYLATPMDQTRGERSPMDINLTVNGDGRNVASGYSFLFGANNRQHNRIYRGDDMVLEKPFEVAEGVGNTHQDWFYVRLERRTTPQGVRFRYSVNGKEIADYIDSQPLHNEMSDPGRIAFWTYNGGLSIARVRLWYHNVDTARDQAPRLPQSTVMGKSAKNAAEWKNSLGEWGARHDDILHPSATLQLVVDKSQPKSRALEITNPQSGGDWTVYATRTAFDATQHPVLRFDYRLSEGVNVNLYAKVDGKWREIIFSGDPALPSDKGNRGRRYRARFLPRRNVVRPNAGPNAAIVPGSPPAMMPETDATISIGRIQNVVADGAWHSASFNLLEALRAANKDGNVSTRIEALAFAAPDRGYLRCGIGGNHLGATYWIRNFDAPARKDAPQSVAATP
ncbi:MAG: serine protease Do, partial [Abditibacteriota bacterium]|nr:serine protease Do [Abditibacteriota bacterium]